MSQTHLRYTKGSLYTKTGLPLTRRLRDRLKFSCGCSSLFEGTLQDWEKDPGVSDVAQELSKTVALLRRRLAIERGAAAGAFDQLLREIGDLAVSHREVSTKLQETETYAKVANLGISDRLLVRRAQTIKQKVDPSAYTEKEVELVGIDSLNSHVRYQKDPSSSILKEQKPNLRGILRKDQKKRLIVIHRSRFDEYLSDNEEDDELEPQNTISQIHESITKLQIPEQEWGTIIKVCSKPVKQGIFRDPLWKIGRAPISGQTPTGRFSSARNSATTEPLENMILSTQTAQLKSAHTMSMRHLEYPKAETRISESNQEYGQTSPQPQQRMFEEPQSSQIRMQSADRFPERILSHRTGSDSKQPFYRSLLSGDLPTTNHRPTPSSPPPSISQQLQFDQPRKLTVASSARTPEITTFGRILSGTVHAQPSNSGYAPQPYIPTSPKESGRTYHRASGSGYMPLSFTTSSRTSAPQPSFVPLSQAHFRQPSTVTNQQGGGNPRNDPIVIRGNNQHWFTG